MKLSRLALAAATAAVWALSPLAAWAQDNRPAEKRTIEIRTRVGQDGGEGEGDREEHRDGPRGGRRDGGRGENQDPEMQEKLEKMRVLEEKAQAEALSLREGTDAEKAAAKAALRKTIGELFDAKLSLETAMLARMEKHVAELKARIGRKKSSREKAIETRFLRMSGEGDEWD